MTDACLSTALRIIDAGSSRRALCGKGYMRGGSNALWPVSIESIAVGAALVPLPIRAGQPLTRIQQACLNWDVSLQRMLGWSEAYAIHPPELQTMVRAEAARLRERCTRDVTAATINRYVVLSKMLYDDEADEVESFD
jgi:hypothetical protein